MADTSKNPSIIGFVAKNNHEFDQIVSSFFQFIPHACVRGIKNHNAHL